MSDKICGLCGQTIPEGEGYDIAIDAYKNKPPIQADVCDTCIHTPPAEIARRLIERDFASTPIEIKFKIGQEDAK